MSKDSLNQKEIGSSSHGKLIFYVVLALMMIIGVGYWFFTKNIGDSLNNNIQTNTVNANNKELGTTKNEIIVSLENSAENGKYGDWPILNNVTTSPSRGNPFTSFIVSR